MERTALRMIRGRFLFTSSRRFSIAIEPPSEDVLFYRAVLDPADAGAFFGPKQ
jgi:hypothetical protein